MKLRGVRGLYERDRYQSAKQTYKRPLRLQGLARSYGTVRETKRRKRTSERRAENVPNSRRSILLRRHTDERALFKQLQGSTGNGSRAPGRKNINKNNETGEAEASSSSSP